MLIESDSSSVDGDVALEDTSSSGPDAASTSAVRGMTVASTSTAKEDAFQAAMDLARPFLLSPSKEDEAKAIFTRLGVTSQSSFDNVLVSEVESVMTAVDFRRMLASRTTLGPGAAPASFDIQVPGRYIVDIKALTTPFLMQKMESKEDVLDASERRRIINVVADDMVDNKVVVSEKLVYDVSKSLVKRFPRALGCVHDENGQMAVAISDVKNCMMGHLNHVKRFKRGHDELLPSDKRVRFSTHQEYGLNSELDIPRMLPPGETCDLQETKRLHMVEMEATGRIDWASVYRLCSETYTSQRTDIHRGLLIEELLQRWPYIGKIELLQNHFFKLVNRNMDDIRQNMTQVLPNMLKFFAFASTRQRKGASKSIPDQLNNILKSHAARHRLGETQEDMSLIAVLWCLMVHLSISIDKVLICFDECASFDQIQSSSKLPDDGRPVIAVLGQELLLNPKSCLIIAKRIISRFQASLSKNILALLMSFFVFKIACKAEAAPIYEFLQRDIFNIISDEGSRIERKKGKKGWNHSSPLISSRYASFVRHYTMYTQKYNHDAST